MLRSSEFGGVRCAPNHWLIAAILSGSKELGISTASRRTLIGRRHSVAQPVFISSRNFKTPSNRACFATSAAVSIPARRAANSESHHADVVDMSARRWLITIGMPRRFASAKMEQVVEIHRAVVGLSSRNLPCCLAAFMTASMSTS